MGRACSRGAGPSGPFLGGSSLKNGLNGWANIYLGNEQYWDERLWRFFGPAMLVGLAAIVAWVVVRRLPRGFQGDVFPHAYGILWLVLLTQNLIAQLITGPHSVWSETVFGIYYGLLFLLSAVIVVHMQWRKRWQEWGVRRGKSLTDQRIGDAVK